jgi:hypothetical protein
MLRRVPAALLSASLILVAAACGGVTDPSKNQNETFSGTVDPVSGGGGGLGTVHTFSVKNTGEWTAVVTALTPSTNVAFGLVYGQNVSGQCSIITTNPLSHISIAGLGGPITAGSYCIAVYDAGNFTVTEAYTLSVSHP